MENEVDAGHKPGLYCTGSALRIWLVDVGGSWTIIMQRFSMGKML